MEPLQVTIGAGTGASEYFAVVPQGPVAPLLLCAAWRGQLSLNGWQREFLRRCFSPPEHPGQRVIKLSSDKGSLVHAQYVPRVYSDFESLLAEGRRGNNELTEKRERAADAAKETTSLRSEILRLEAEEEVAKQRAEDGEEEETPEAGRGSDGSDDRAAS